MYYNGCYSMILKERDEVYTTLIYDLIDGKQESYQSILSMYAPDSRLW